MSSSAANDHEELVSQFMAITGSSDASTARTYLEMSGTNLEMAIGLFLEHTGGSGGGGTTATTTTTSTTTTSSRGGHYDTDADAALAASLAAQDEEAHEIRAPDATRTMRLMEDGSSSFHPALLAAADPSIRMMHEMMMMPQPQDHHHHRPSAFADSPIVTNRRSARQALDAAMAAAAAGETKQDNDDDDGMGEDDDGEQDYQYDDADDDDDDDVDMQQADDDDDDDERPSAATAPRLSDMFAAPHHLLYRAGGFQGARQMAKDSKRWLLVNLQRDSEFSCHALNRDVWRNDLVENLIREGFIFWQEDDASMEGSQFVQRYHVQAFPHISMIDPRTGRLLWKREGWTQENPMTAQAFAELAMDFCSRNSLDKPPQAPKPPSQQQSQSQSQSQSQQAQSLPSNPDAMTEEEQLEAAVQASMMQQQPNSKDGNDDDEDDEVQFVGHSAAEARAATSPVAPTAAAAIATTTAAAAAPTPALSWMQDLWNIEVTPEPTTAGSSARLSFRMPNGSRVVRSFSPSDTVQMVYAFVAQSLRDGDKEKEDELVTKQFALKVGFPPRDLASQMEQSIQEASLHGEAVTVRWM